MPSDATVHNTWRLPRERRVAIRHGEWEPTRATEQSIALSIPDLVPDVDTLTAALLYAECGWYELPVRRGSKKPGSVVGIGWQRKSSRDPKVITAWFAGTDYGIALHCGRSGAVVFDVDRPDRLPEVLRRHLVTAPYQSTRLAAPSQRHDRTWIARPGRRVTGYDR